MRRAVVSGFEMPLLLVNEGLVNQIGSDQADECSVDRGFVRGIVTEAFGDLMLSERTLRLQHRRHYRDAGCCNTEVFLPQEGDGVFVMQGVHLAAGFSSAGSFFPQRTQQ